MTNTTRTNRPARAGFTLTEIMIVIVILVLLAGFAAINIFGVRDDAKLGLAKTQLAEIQKAIEQFNLAFDRVPTEEEGLAVLWNKESLSTENEADAQKWRKMLNKPMPNDVWGTPWGYRAESEFGEEYDLWSNGPDKEEGTEDDITSWIAEDGGAGDTSGSSMPSDTGSSGTGG